VPILDVAANIGYLKKIIIRVHPNQCASLLVPIVVEMLLRVMFQLILAQLYQVQYFKKRDLERCALTNLIAYKDCVVELLITSVMIQITFRQELSSAFLEALIWVPH
jgi:hypothetical protein